MAKQLSTKLPLGCLGCFSFSCGRKQFGKRNFLKMVALGRIFLNSKYNCFVFELLQLCVEGNIYYFFVVKPLFLNFSEAASTPVNEEEISV